MTRPSLAGITQRARLSARVGGDRYNDASAADVPALSAAIRAVLRFHTEREHRPLDGIYLGGTVCNHCRRPWPCSTVVALAAHLDLTDPEGDPT